MVTLTNAVAVANCNRWRFKSYSLDDDTGDAYVIIELLSPGTGLAQRFQLTVANVATRPGVGLRVNASPRDWTDIFANIAVTATAGAADRIETAFRSGGTKAAARSAVETQLIADGYVSSTATTNATTGLAGTVS